MNLDEMIQHFKLPDPIETSLLTGGANNRVYKLTFKQQNPLILKQYFQHLNDKRFRLQAEFLFLQYVWKMGIRNVPEPLFFSLECNAALYAYIPGRPVQVTDLSNELIQEMIAFFQAINRQKSEAAHLPLASDACFSIKDYLRITEKRIERLQNVPIETPLEKELSTFCTDSLIPKWTRIKTRCECKAALHYAHSIPYQDHCISPSDFGFHNALIADGRKLFFIDFEYAGWDDPCKTVCDLFCQPKIPIQEKYFSLLSHAISSTVADPDSCLQRIEILLPVIQMKWCCILLNAFTQVGKNRRAFSYSDENAHKEKQLNKAKQLLLKIEETSWPI